MGKLIRCNMPYESSKGCVDSCANADAEQVAQADAQLSCLLNSLLMARRLAPALGVHSGESQCQQ